jgi:hypothetical protein
MLSLSDAELQIVMAAAAPLRPRDRDGFMADVATRLALYPELGPGIVSRVCRELQRRHFDPPTLQGSITRYSR